MAQSTNIKDLFKKREVLISKIELMNFELASFNKKLNMTILNEIRDKRLKFCENNTVKHTIVDGKARIGINPNYVFTVCEIRISATIKDVIYILQVENSEKDKVVVTMDNFHSYKFL